MEVKPMKHRRTKGFSIVELMVAILIGLIILAGVIQVVITSKTTFVGQEEMSFIQENARYAMDVIGKDIQSAGYWGCAGPSARFAVAAKDSAAAPGLVRALPVGGYDGTSHSSMPTYLKDRMPLPSGVTESSDVLILRGAEGTMVGIQTHDGTTITTAPEKHKIKEKAYFVVIGEDCRRVSIVKAATTTDTEIPYEAGADNCSTAIKPSLLKKSFDCTESYEAYSPGATIMEYGAKAYFVGDSSAINGFPALKRVVFKDGGITQEELALGVEDMQIMYGVVSVGGGVQYKTASDVGAAEWPQIGSVQVQMVFRSQSATAQRAVAQTFLGKTYNDGFMRQLVSTTFRLRNRI
jgi:type IV pilus assembly protein PilW